MGKKVWKEVGWAGVERGERKPEQRLELALPARNSLVRAEFRTCTTNKARNSLARLEVRTRTTSQE